MARDCVQIIWGRECEMDVLKRFPSALFVNNIEALESVRVSHSSVLSTLTQL